MSNQDQNQTQDETSVDNPHAQAIIDIQSLRENNRRQTKIIMVQSLMVAALVPALVMAFISRPLPRYIGITPDLRVVHMTPLSEPVITDEGLTNWTADTVTKAMSLDFVHVHQQLASVASSFSPDAFNAFVKNLKGSGLYDKVMTQKLSLSVVPQSAPIIVNSGPLDGVFSWRLTFPITVTYEGSNGNLGSQTFKATVLVQRASTLKYPRGVIIQQIVLE